MGTRFDRDDQAAGPIVTGIGARGFTVDGGVYPALLLTPERADGWDHPALADLTIDDLAALLALDPVPEFILLGTGTTMAFPSKSLKDALAARGLGVEAMDSRAAARTWGMLRAEGRWVAAAIMRL